MAWGRQQRCASCNAEGRLPQASFRMFRQGVHLLCLLCTACHTLCRVGTALVIGGLLTRGMHRGSLDRTSAKAKGNGTAAANGTVASPGLRRAGSGASKALLLPLTIPVVRQASDGVLSGDADAAAAKKDDAMAIAVDVQAGALASGQQDGSCDDSAHVRSPSPVGSGVGGGPSVAIRRKALEMG